MTSVVLNDAEFRRLIDRLQTGVPLQAGLTAAAVVYKGFVSIPPPEPGARPPHPFVSDKQRRYFFFALKAGLIEVPYRRAFSPASESFSRKAAWEVSESGGGLVVNVGTNVSYAPYLIGSNGSQSVYMRGLGWQTTREIYEANREAILKQAVEAARQSLFNRDAGVEF